MSGARRGWRPRPNPRRLTVDETLDHAERLLLTDPAKARRLVGGLGYIDLTSTAGDTGAALERIGRARRIVATVTALADPVPS